MDLDKGAGLTLDRGKIPVALQYLIPYVERWGFESLEEQDAFATAMLAQRRGEVQEFNATIDKADEAIRQWGATLSELDKNLSEFTDADRAHPYWSFLHMLKIREITGYSEDDAEVLAANQRFALEVRQGKYDAAVEKADAMFRAGEYAAYLAILRPFEDMLSPAQKKKFELALRRSK